MSYQSSHTETSSNKSEKHPKKDDFRAIGHKMKIYTCKMCLAPLYRSKEGAYCIDCNDVTKLDNLSPKQIVDRDIVPSLVKGVLRA